MRRIVLVLLIIAVGCADDAEKSSEPEQSFCGAVEDFRTGLADLGPGPNVDPPLSEEDRQVITSYNRSVSRLAEPLKDSAPGELRDALDTIADADPTEPDATRSPEHQSAMTEVAAYIETECGIDTEDAP